MADAYSAFQKYVRRGDVDAALYWGAQIGRPYPNALKKRLLQHAMEDVGHIGFAFALLKIKPTWDVLRTWIVLLTSMPKTRAAAWLNRVAVDFVCDPSLASTLVVKTAAEALCMHRDEKKTELEALYGKEAMKLYKEINNEVLVFHVLNLTRSGIIVPAALPSDMPPVPEVDYESPREIPDWVYDKHTAKGKRLGRGYAHFLETMVVAPRLFEGVEPFEAEGRVLYTNGKEQRVRHILAASKPKPSPPPKPSPKPVPAVVEELEAVEEKAEEKAEEAAEEAVVEVEAAEEAVVEVEAAAEAVKFPPPKNLPMDIPKGYTNFLQAQAITARSKPRVWFCTEEATGKHIIIKGPSPLAERVGCLKTEKMKKLLGLSRTNVRTHGSYILQDSLIDYTKLPTRVMNTTLEKDIVVPAVSTIPGWDHSMLKDAELAYEIMEKLLLRKLVGTNDTCARNFVVIGKKVYSIDDAALGVETKFMWKVALVRPLKAYTDALTRVWERLAATMERWRPLLAEDAFALRQLEIHSVKANWKWA
jgi:hypothetical protein